MRGRGGAGGWKGGGEREGGEEGVSSGHGRGLLKAPVFPKKSARSLKTTESDPKNRPSELHAKLPNYTHPKLSFR